MALKLELGENAVFLFSPEKIGKESCVFAILAALSTIKKTYNS